ncbi:hypothetical protein DFS34DRAFT_624178 [Phlyctochytrium arcticum]|nr:hypothetical protein DFS34DRAFT_624178 [Phlyctochytrium arcticum]
MTKPANIELLTEEDAFIPACEEALKEIFARFDVDKDNSLSREELDNFAIAANGEKFDDATLEELKESFDVTKEGNLTLDGFIDMYHLQTLSDEDETWKDLKKFGYNDQIEKVSTSDAASTTTATATA